MEPTDVFRVGELGLVGGGFVFLLRWMMTRFEKELKEISSATQNLAKAINIQSIAILSLQKQFLTHDLTVRGLNPSTGEDMNERAETAIKAYAEIQHSLTELSHTISSMNMP